jgi:dephospho-CoA kinase
VNQVSSLNEIPTVIKIGLTGGIGTGKSTALDVFSELGCVVQDCDLVVAEIYASDDEFKKDLLNHFGESVFTDGEPDKKHIAEIVFQNSSELEWLNKQLHGRVRTTINNRLQENKINIVAVPLLHESEWHKSFTKSICVWCPDKLRLKRLLGRGLSHEESLRRIKTQMPQDEKLQRSDFALINDMSIDYLRKQCQQIFNILKN